MGDGRLDRLAEVIVHHSLRLTAGETVLIEVFDVPEAVPAALIRVVVAAGARPVVSVKQNAVLRELYRSAPDEAIALAGEVERFRMEQVQAYVGIRGSHNITELSDVPAERLQAYQRLWWKPVHIDWRISRTRWVVLRYPTAAMAQQAEMSTEAFTDFFFRVCTLDYGRMLGAAEALKARMERTDRVHVTGPGTDLAFSIRGIPAIPCYGRRNLPDGECFTAPVRESVEGVITFNAPTIYQGVPFTGVRLTFEKGRVVAATADKPERLNALLDADAGARCLGEFSLAFNPYILQPMRDILFDEKIAGSLHLALGNAYEIADNGNRSAIHWDLVLIQRPEWGGGEVAFDGEVIRKDGKFVAPDLILLNPEHLG
ncbi:MAG: aminopeptidase [candidate division NC10 bacterium]|nr:aminopeptidase [candidate division NC10 bacterium]